MTSNTTSSLAVATLVLALTVGGGAYAAAGDSGDGMIYACAKTMGGELRVIEDAEQCRNSERRLSWNRRGPQGETGAPGPQGETGPAGPQGPTGPAGPQGEDGAAGPHGDVGPAGETGPTGDAGATGETGLAGDAGPAGETGPAGAKGDPGQDGATGPAGADGKDGEDGAPGPQGEQGIQGEAGPQGPAGSGGGASAREVTRGFGPVNSGINQQTIGVATMYDVAPGSYVISGKATVRAPSGGSYSSAMCFLRLGTSIIDTTRVGTGTMASATLPLQATMTLTSTTTLTLQCSLPPNGAFASDTKLHVLKVGELSSEQEVIG